jgi:hypothetical protein
VGSLRRRRSPSRWSRTAAAAAGAGGAEECYETRMIHAGHPRRDLYPCGARLHPQRTRSLLHDASDRRRRADAEDLEDRTARRPTETGTCRRACLTAGSGRSIRTAGLPRLFFTETGLAALRAMMRDRRLADPERFAHIRVELRIDPQTEAKAAE